MSLYRTGFPFTTFFNPFVRAPGGCTKKKPGYRGIELENAEGRREGRCCKTQRWLWGAPGMQNKVELMYTKNH